MQPASTLADAIQTYHRLLESDSALAEASAEALTREQPPRDLTFGDKPLCGVLRPQFLTPSTYRRIQQVCSLLSSAMFRLAERMLEDPDLLAPLHLTPAELELIAVDPGFRQVSPTTRLDSFLVGEDCHFVEYNAETPAAIAYEDGLSELFAELPVMKRFCETHRATPLPARHRLRDVLLDVYRQWSAARQRPTIAIVDWKGLPTATEHELLARYFRDSGLDAFIAEPAELDYGGRQLSAGGRRIDLVYRRVLTAELFSRPEQADALVRAYKARQVCVVNSFRSKLLHKKMIFALLSDERYAHHFSDAERAAIERHIPWTRQVVDGRSTHRGQPIDLVQFVLEKREGLVLKPNDEYGGKGVVVGWESAPAEWEAAVSEALTEPHVVQERVQSQADQFPVWRDGRLEWQELTADLDPFLFHTEVGGVLTRLSAAALLNVTAGTGSLAPTFLVEPR